jgi:hypothetical protein
MPRPSANGFVKTHRSTNRAQKHQSRVETSTGLQKERVNFAAVDTNELAGCDDSTETGTNGWFVTRVR